jgi:plasmid maintenance system antidote protein VapI
MFQPEIPMRGGLTAPVDAPRGVLAACESEAQALRLSIEFRGHSDSWFARELGRSRSYFSEIVNGKKAIPDWMIAPLCVLTGTNLLAQYRKWQQALNVVDAVETEAQREARIVNEWRRTA